MAIYQIIKENNKILRTKAIKVTKITTNIHKLLNNLQDTMYFYKGVGLAAPQIGISKRVIVIDAGEGLIEIINPSIVNSEGQELGTEGCLSIPGILGEVPRATQVLVTGLNRHGKEIKIKANSLLARALQHEIDHLDGILFIDRAVKIKRE
ncbi:peptide deformylase [Peptococcaceae bacterium SCADC1_2_3]|nr:peptide deformylase [Peptococcaceae bacterium SCADC1_2_3]KFI34950.1 peptide deformylase [Peptococcaceae bacterium SCADC1_2_3]KFI38194.1 peptide deformylase [Peptococcaceae bacterium SCADC1_2_3]